MPVVIDTHELIDVEQVEIHTLTIKQPPARNVRPRFLRMMAQRIIERVTRTPHAEHAPAYYQELHRFEAPMDRFIRAHPSIAPYALAIV